MPLLTFGVYLARRGIMPVVSMVICALTALGLAIFAIWLGAHGARAPVYDVPILASSALAWGGGFLHAFATAAHALRRDREGGIRDLLVTRTMSLRGYLVARVGGLAVLLMITVGGGTLLCGLVAAGANTGAVSRTLHATFAAVVFAIAFAAVVAPVAFAALGARSRVGGYLFLLGVVVVPELIANVLAGVLPAGITEVLAIPAALGALRSALAPGGFDALRALRAVVALAVFVIGAVLLVRRDAVRLERAEVGNMITVANVVARGKKVGGRPAPLLRGVTFERESGVFVVVGTPADGTSLLLRVLAGAAPMRSGSITIGGNPPEEARRIVAYVPLETSLPDAMRVEEICDLAAVIRREPAIAAEKRLAPFGIQALRTRVASSLSPSESRAVSLAIAISSHARVILVEEPLAFLEAPMIARVTELLRVSGAAVIATTASVRDASRLGDALAVMTHGVLTPLPSDLAHAGRLRVVVASAVGEFVAALAAAAEIESVETHAYASSDARAILVSGADPIAVAGAVGRAAAHANADIRTIESAVAPLEAIRATLAEGAA